MASSLETNKIFGAILTAGIIASGSGVISRILYHPTVPEETAYQIEIGDEGGDAGGDDAPAPIGVRLAAADAGAGEGEARVCGACHSFEPGGAHGIGPALYGVVGRDIAAAEGFGYSEVLSGLEGDWTYEALDAFIENPSGYAAGTNMSYAGLSDGEDRADLLMYLRSLSEDPLPLPEVEETPEAPEVAEGATGEDPSGADQGGEGGGFATLVAAADPAAGEQASAICKACHSFEIGGPNGIGPALGNVVGRDIASVDGFSYSDALQSLEGAWDYAALDGYLADPKAFAPGNRMTFVGIQDDDDRAAVVAYLRSVTENPPAFPEAAETGDEPAAETDQAAAETGDEPAPETEQAAAETSDEPAPETDQAAAETGDEPAPETEQAAAETSGDALAGTEQPTADAGGDSAATDGASALVAMIDAADLATGSVETAICKACHSFGPGEAHRIGPNLHDVVGRDIASAEGFSYSPALQELEGAWSFEALDGYLTDPRTYAPGNRMIFAGISDAEKRAAVIAYLRSLSASGN